jgi:Uma2 family endonuclease
LSRDEFERRFDSMPGLKKAELIEGVVYMPSPAGVTAYGIPFSSLLTWAGSYRIETPGIEGAASSSVRLDSANMPQPDLIAWIEPDKGGQCRLTDDYLTDAPEMVGEISANTKHLDLGLKFQIYQRNGVREYIVWRVLDKAVDWFVLRGQRYYRLEPGADGITRSEIFPGLWLDGAALVARDMAQVNRVLQLGLASPEHAEFVQKLK